MRKATAVEIRAPYTLFVTFNDGTHRTIDMEGELWGEVFAPLRDLKLFALASVEPDGGSVYWPTGADLSPEFLSFGDDGPPEGFYSLSSEATVDEPVAAVGKPQ